MLSLSRNAHTLYVRSFFCFTQRNGKIVAIPAQNIPKSPYPTPLYPVPHKARKLIFIEKKMGGNGRVLNYLTSAKDYQKNPCSKRIKPGLPKESRMLHTRTTRRVSDLTGQDFMAIPAQNYTEKSPPGWVGGKLNYHHGSDIMVARITQKILAVSR